MILMASLDGRNGMAYNCGRQSRDRAVRADLLAEAGEARLWVSGATARQFPAEEQWFSFQLKRQAGFGKGGEKNFEGTVTDLQMQGYLLIRDFRQRLNKRGQPYGWPISVYSTPEALWGYAHITSAYAVEPEESRARIDQQVLRNFPGAAPEALAAVLGGASRR